MHILITNIIEYYSFIVKAFIYATTSGKVCGLLTVLLGTWRGPDSIDRPIRVLTGPCQELKCKDHIKASWQSHSVPARFLPGSCQDCQEAPGGSRRLQELQGLGTRTIC